VGRIFVTADPHFSHTNIIKYCERPFIGSYEHDIALITNWNSLVTDKDEVWCLGDFGLASPQWLFDKIATKLNGKIYLIKGNHDKSSTKEPLCNRFEKIMDVHFLKTQCDNKKVEIFLSHYAHRSWPKSHRGSYHFYGHSHGKLPFYYNSLDVGVDTNSFFPYSLREALNKIDRLNPPNASIL
jgi:calcineurin-like phosphoesterase family protein